MRTDNDIPCLAVAPAELSAIAPLDHQRPIPTSRMFEIKRSLGTYREHNPGSETFDVSQGDGGASLPGVPRQLLERAADLQIDRGTSYDKPCGTDLFRQAVVENYWQLDGALGWGPENVVACQGGRDALIKAYQAALHLGPGRRGQFVLVSRVPWISYRWGTYAVGANVILAPGQAEDGWSLSTDGIDASVTFAETHQRSVAMLVVTSPDNPTGRTLTIEQQVALAQHAIASGIPYVLFDWIYHRVSEGPGYDVNALLRALTPQERARTIILDGITKSLGASNIRCAHLMADRSVIDFVSSYASHGVIPSFFSQAVAVAAYQQGFADASRSLVTPTNKSRTLLRGLFDDAGWPYIMGDGYYAFINLAEIIENSTFADTAELGAWLAETCGVAVVPGVYFSDAAAKWIRVSYALDPAHTRRAVERLRESLQRVDAR